MILSSIPINKKILELIDSSKFQQAKLATRSYFKNKTIKNYNQQDSCYILLKSHRNLASISDKIFDTHQNFIKYLKTFSLKDYMMKNNTNFFYYKNLEEGKYPDDDDIEKSKQIEIKIQGEYGFDPQLAFLAIHSKGKTDLQFTAHLLTSLISSILQPELFKQVSHFPLMKPIFMLSKQFKVLKQEIKENQVDQQIYNKYVSFLANETVQDYEEIISEIKKRLFYVHISRHKPTLHYLEKILIQCLGHFNEDVRDSSVVFLNNLYDGIDWQTRNAFKPVVKTIGEVFYVQCDIFYEEKKDCSQNSYIFLLNAPSINEQDIEYMVTWYPCQIEKIKSPLFQQDDEDQHFIIRARIQIGKFWRCGFFDWRIMSLREDGILETVKADGATSEIKLDNSQIDLTQCVGLTQGRFIVQPSNIRQIQPHQVLIDAELSLNENQEAESDDIGKFADMRKSLPKYQSQGVNCLYLLGALERDNGQKILKNNKDGEQVCSFQREKVSQLAITCRRSTCSLLGGDQQFKLLIKDASKLGIRVVVDCIARVSSSRAHRRYKNLKLRTLNNQGAEVYCYGTDGRNKNYKDSVMLNYRKKQAWDMLIEDIVQFVSKFGVDGIHLDNGQGWPNIFEQNMDELLRRDSDGVRVYSDQEVLDGEIIDRGVAQQGYWSSGKREHYANPFLVRLCKELWRRFPNFVIFAECQGGGGEGRGNRHPIVAKSGPIPRIFEIPFTLAKVWGKELSIKGQITHTGKRSTIKQLHRWYRRVHKNLPQGGIIAQSSTSHYQPLPALLYQRGAWPAVDILFFMPDIPFTFMGEQQGKAYRLATTNLFQAFDSTKRVLRSNSQIMLGGLLNGMDENQILERLEKDKEDEEQEKSIPGLYRQDSEQWQVARQWGDIGKFINVGSASAIDQNEGKNKTKQLQKRIAKIVGPDYGFNLNEIIHHYNHRRKLRRDHLVLRSGKVIPILAKQINYPHNDHTHVLSFIRFSYQQSAIITINLHEEPVGYYLILQQFLKQLTKHCNENEQPILAVSNLFTPNTTIDEHKDLYQQYYFLNEFINEKKEYSLDPFRTLVLRVIACNDDEYAKECAVRDSYRRLQICIEKPISSGKGQNYYSPVDHIDICRRMINGVKENDIQVVGVCIARLQEDFCIKAKISLQRLIYHIKALRQDHELAAKFFAMCSVLQNKSPKLKSHLWRLNEHNEIGTILFAAPQFSHFSKVGGLAVMVDELAQGLVPLGANVIVISPFYDINKQGEKDYLKKDNIHYEFNLKIGTGDGFYQIGVHSGKWKNLQLYFLHNSQLFPQPYNEGDTQYIIKQKTVFAKGCLQLCCYKKIFPSFILTNDWFTGLVPAYGKNKFFFGDTFKHTTFFHIVHNLQAEYEGMISVENHQFDRIGKIHGLDHWLVYDTIKRPNAFNPSRCALIMSDQWGTVSVTYKEDLLRSSQLNEFLRRFPHPFAYPNGVNVKERTAQMVAKVGDDHLVAKQKVQQKYFGYSKLDNSVPLFGFIGRITRQKGVRHIVDTAESLIHEFKGKINILVGGMIFAKEDYGVQCANAIKYLKSKYPNCFWGDPYSFFLDGPLVNLGCDFGLMPSSFEPGGIVQHQFFVAGTPVIAYETGGLKDSVFEFNWEKQAGNGITFMGFDKHDYNAAIHRAIALFRNEEKYKIARQNAKNSVNDLGVVSQAWMKEFFRLKQKLFYVKNIKQEKIKQIEDIKWNEQILENQLNKINNSKDLKTKKPAQFKISNKGKPMFKSVSVSGEFTKWKNQFILTYDHYTECWHTTLHLEEGSYKYKYKVDGAWITSHLEAIRQEGGIQDNILIV